MPSGVSERYCFVMRKKLLFVIVDESGLLRRFVTLARRVSHELNIVRCISPLVVENLR